MPGVLHIPLEALPNAFGCEDLAWLNRGSEAGRTSSLSRVAGHYLSKSSTEPALSPEQWSFARVSASIAAGATPSYDSFFSDRGFCRDTVGCLYKRDVDLYLRTCTAPHIRTCSAYMEACAHHIGRLRDVCGLSVSRAKNGSWVWTPPRRLHFSHL